MFFLGDGLIDQEPKNFPDDPEIRILPLRKALWG
jgi:hypothetical protein